MYFNITVCIFRVNNKVLRWRIQIDDLVSHEILWHPKKNSYIFWFFESDIMRIFQFVVSFCRNRSTSVVFRARYHMLFFDDYRGRRTFARQRQQEKRCGSCFTYSTLQPIISNILPSHACCEERVQYHDKG